MRRWIIFLGILVAISCKENPYPEEGEITKNTPPPLEIHKPVLGLGVESHYYAQEGQWNTFGIEAFVPEPGEPVIKIDGLPEGAYFDEEKQSIHWKPSFEAAGGGEQNYKVYKMTVWLSSTENETQAISKDMSVTVQNVNRGMELEVEETSYELFEGEQVSQLLKITDHDDQTGPFILTTEDVAGLRISYFSETEFKLSFAPKRGFVDLYKRSGDSSGNSSCWSSYGRCYKVNLIVHISGPQNTVKQNITFRVVEKKLVPIEIESKEGFLLKVFEGETVEETIVINDQNDPEGPFEVTVSGLMGVEVKKLSKTKFKISYTPERGLVDLLRGTDETCKEDGIECHQITGTIHVKGPRKSGKESLIYRVIKEVKKEEKKEGEKE